MNTFTLSLLAAALLSTNVLADTSSPVKPVVVELFTSQGCNSCPPADALLGELANQPGVIALAFHVDYWDSLGWRDPYALPESAKRQREYASAQRASSVFTPQMMLNGRTSVIGGQRSNVLEALKAAREAAFVPVKVQVATGQLNVTLEPRTDKSRFNVNVVAYLPEAATSVGRGENAGRILKEYNIVRALRTMGVWDEKRSSFSLLLSTLPADASQLAVLVQDVDMGTIVGAAKVVLH